MLIMDSDSFFLFSNSNVQVCAYITLRSKELAMNIHKSIQTVTEQLLLDSSDRLKLPKKYNIKSCKHLSNLKLQRGKL